MDGVVDFAVVDNTIYILRDNDVDKFSISGTTLTRVDTLPVSNNALIKNQSVTLEKIEVVEDSLILLSNNASFSLKLDGSLELTKNITIKTSEQFNYSSSNYGLTSSNNIINTKTGSNIKSLNLTSVSGFTKSGNYIYISSKNTHEVYKLNINSGELLNLNINPPININFYNPKEFLHLQLTANTDLFLKPYSINKTSSLTAGSYVNVIGEYLNFYYCLVTNGLSNEFYYINKSTPAEVINLGWSSGSFTATRELKIFKFPSTITDETNIVIKTISAGTKIEVETSTTLQNTMGELFYVTKTDEGYGFIRSNFLQSTRGTVELTTPCNAKTKRETALFEDSSGAKTIINLSKGTRVALLEDPAPNKTYLKAEYQDANGVIYTGYINSSDVTQDGLSTLQILGLILIIANLLVLTLIILIKRRSKKWKVKTHTGDTPLPHHKDLDLM